MFFYNELPRQPSCRIQLGQEAVQVSKEAHSPAETPESPVNMTELGTEVNDARDLSSTVLFCILIDIGNRVSLLFGILARIYSNL